MMLCTQVIRDVTCLTSAQFQFFLLVLLPVALELFLYGIFLSIFGLSIYVFRQKLRPGKLYVMATLLFFALATSSVIIDLLSKHNAFLEFIGSSPALNFNEELLDQYRESLHTEGFSFATKSIFFVTSALEDLLLLHRCCCLWNARKIVIIPLALTVLGIIPLGIFLQFGFGKSNSLFIVYVVVGIFKELILTGMLASRLWWLNRQAEKLLGKNSRNVITNLTQIFLESGMLLLLFLGVALAMNEVISQFGLTNSMPQGEPGIESMCSFTQVTAIVSTLILVRIGLGVDVQPSEGKHRTNMDPNTAVESLAPDLEQAIINVEDSNSVTPHPFLLKYHDLSSGATFMPAGSATVRPFSLKYQAPSPLPEPGRIIGRLIRPFSLKYIIPPNSQALSEDIADVHPISDDHSLDFESDLPRYQALNEVAASTC
ncbi:hypothetical protein BDP27DRAFT_313409 [Rhodocollybia butyracea]|uniref:Uncharacterized protein n=1 Tax=Rhodocollybia butyracea TaxID=206335 RepID=A0A9P5U0Z2_9AGAR|nr:hypothetical protein BDP27DRAFT_313409 [Rhodocollybia butyracea]